MLEELSSALSNYYRTPTNKNGKPKNLVLAPIGNNINEINQNENFPQNRVLNNNNYYLAKTPNFAFTPNYNLNNRIITPNYHNNEKINYLYNQPNLSNDFNINNRNENIKKRAKSAAKARKNSKNVKLLNNNNYQNYTFNNGNANNNIKKNNRLKNNKSPLLKNIKINNNDYIEDEYDFNNNMNQFENIVNVINLNGFHKLKDEINDKKIIIAQLENSIAVLKNKICICKSNLYEGLHRETKNKIKYENMLCVSNRFKNIGKTADNYKNDINNFRNKIDALNDETFQLKNYALNEQNYIEIMKEEIKKGNKGISDKQKEIENILPALQLLKNHIASVKQKIKQFNNIKRNYIEELTYMGDKI